jgi:hypothetical protein
MSGAGRRGPALPGSWRGPRAVIWSLAGELERTHRLPRPYKDAAGDVGLLSACRDVTVWYIEPLGHLLRWREAGTEITWPASDINGAAARIAARCRELPEDAPGGPP